MKATSAVVSLRWPFKDHFSRYWHCKNVFLSVGVGLSMKFLLRCLNFTKVHNLDVLEDHILNRADNVPLISVCNHTSCLDDPGILGLVSVKALASGEKFRWGLGAHDVMFTNRFLSWFFSHGKAVPIIRGAGVYQRAMDFAVDQLNHGRWVHIFPEGRVNMTDVFMRFKWGVGRLIADCNQVPIILPFYHLGMDDVLPNRAPYFPRVAKCVTVLVGEPFSPSAILDYCHRTKKSATETRKILTDEIQLRLEKMKPETEKLHLENMKQRRSWLRRDKEH